MFRNNKFSVAVKKSVKNEAKNVISDQNDKIKDEINTSLGRLTDNLAKIL